MRYHSHIGCPTQRTPLVGALAMVAFNLRPEVIIGIRIGCPRDGMERRVVERICVKSHICSLVTLDYYMCFESSKITIIGFIMPTKGAEIAPGVEPILCRSHMVEGAIAPPIVVTHGRTGSMDDTRSEICGENTPIGFPGIESDHITTLVANHSIVVKSSNPDKGTI